MSEQDTKYHSKKNPETFSTDKRRLTVPDDSKGPNGNDAPSHTAPPKVKFEIYGEEMIEKRVKASGNSGRVYLPPGWVGHHVKIIRID